MLAACVQNEMMKCFEFGLVTGVAKVCVTSLRICSLEMQDQMARVLPSILISLSKISATVAMAIPVLAFLSSECCHCFIADMHSCACMRMHLHSHICTCILA